MGQRSALRPCRRHTVWPLLAVRLAFVGMLEADRSVIERRGLLRGRGRRQRCSSAITIYSHGALHKVCRLPALAPTDRKLGPVRWHGPGICQAPLLQPQRGTAQFAVVARPAGAGQTGGRLAHGAGADRPRLAGRGADVWLRSPDLDAGVWRDRPYVCSLSPLAARGAPSSFSSAGSPPSCCDAPGSADRLRQRCLQKASWLQARARGRCGPIRRGKCRNPHSRRQGTDHAREAKPAKNAQVLPGQSSRNGRISMGTISFCRPGTSSASLARSLCSAWGC